MESESWREPADPQDAYLLIIDGQIAAVGIYQDEALAKTWAKRERAVLVKAPMIADYRGYQGDTKGDSVSGS